MRPTKYSKEILKRAEEYLLLDRPCDIETNSGILRNEVIPTIEGLALYLSITKPTIYDWISQEDKEPFSYFVSKIMEKQGFGLANGGLRNEFNSKISAVMLSKHGYREGKELTGVDGKDLFDNDDKEKANKAIGEFIEGNTK